MDYDLKDFIRRLRNAGSFDSKATTVDRRPFSELVFRADSDMIELIVELVNSEKLQ
jgi:hypothetical protein